MAKSKSSVVAEVEPVESSAWTAPEIPTLSPDEVAQAIETGGFHGLFLAIFAKIPPLPVETNNAVTRLTRGPIANAFEKRLMAFKAGDACSLEEMVAPLLPGLIAAGVIGAATVAIVEWMHANSGEIVNDSSTASGQRRIFS